MTADSLEPVEQVPEMQRICVVGCSGGGKSTLAKQLAEMRGLPHIELDSLYHQPNWASLSTQEFRKRVEAFTDQSRWVVDGNYFSDIGDISWGRADTVIWMDIPRHVATGRVIKRTFGRLMRRKELWNGNRERLREALSRDPERSIIVWAWARHDKYTARYAKAMRDEQWRHINFVRVRSAREARSLLQSLEANSI